MASGRSYSLNSKFCLTKPAIARPSPYPWLAALIAIAIFSPVVYWNAIHDWVSFEFQLDRPMQLQGWSLKFRGEFVGHQFLLLGPILFPVVLVGVSRLGWRGFRAGDPVVILLATCVAVPFGFFLWRSLHGRIGDSWPLFVWPFGFACVAINIRRSLQEAPDSSMARMALRYLPDAKADQLEAGA